MTTPVFVEQKQQPADAATTMHPRAPQTLEESGLNLDLLVQLALKQLHFSGELTGVEWAKRLGLEYSVIDPAVDFLKRNHDIEIVGGALIGGASYRYRITDAGRQRAGFMLEHSRYVGTAPVPLAQYVAYLNAYQRAMPCAVSRDRVRKAFSHLVIADQVLDQLGPAIAAGHSMFVYGPPGNGKTVIAQAIRNLLEGDIAVPHAIEVEGNIVRVFDPVNHEPLPEERGNGLSREVGPDRRWIRCKRPMVMVGGELTLESLELSYSQTSGFYRAPVQAIATGGVLVIDDFGRQQCSPRELLNRWIVPLESRVDYLTLQTGQKFELPFMVLVVFATNIKPAELVDEAFLRRIHYKVFAQSPSVQDFLNIFANCCRERGIEFDASLAQRLLVEYFRPRKIQLRGCQPRDLIEQAISRADYLGVPRHLSYDLLEAACASYFVDDTENAPVYA